MCSARSAGLGGRTAGGLLALQLAQRIEPEVELVRHRHRALLPLRPAAAPTLSLRPCPGQVACVRAAMSAPMASRPRSVKINIGWCVA